MPVNASMSTAVRAVRAAFLLLLLCIIAMEIAAAEEPSVDPPERVARLSHADGEVSVAPAGTDGWAEAALNRPLTSGDRLWVEGRARAEVQVGAALVHLDANTGFGFLELDDDVVQMSLTEGVATVHVFSRGENDVLQVETPNGRVSLLHPGEYTIEVVPEDDATIVSVRSGAAEVLAGEESHAVGKGQALSFQGGDTVEVEKQRLAARSDFETWANDRARDRQEPESGRYVSSGVTGYEDLDDHGEWIYEREYGYVWRPMYVTVDWAPYRYGRWVWIAPWGYTWIDSAPWGFAPFHYGRWAHIHNRWCWVPGPRHLRPMYSPAVVGWTGDAGTLIGWFPLGPRDVFVPGYRHSPRYVRLVNERNSRFVNDRELRAVGSRTGFTPDYRFGHDRGAITVADRGRFLAGRPLDAARSRTDDRDIDRWRPQARPPALTPYRESVLGGTPRPALRAQRDRQRETGYRQPTRIPFEAERRAIEANGGRPPSRGELRDGPKRGDDFRGTAWLAQHDVQRRSSAAQSTPTSESPRALHELGAIRQPLPSGERTWRTQQPDRQTDRDRNRVRASADPERLRQPDAPLRASTSSWRSSGDSSAQDRSQRDRNAWRTQESQPAARREAPARVERSPQATPSQSPAPRTEGNSRSNSAGRPTTRTDTR